ncbi:MAG: hypothetical protein JW955_08075 [Sedimentisphaerales bacterium]|nr:hypothetical protein [Sedimentisphaerales bacterium]
MKRHTGQKALYEAIARTQAKMRRRGILERLRPGSDKKVDGQPPVEPPKSETEPAKSPVEAAGFPVEKAVEKLPAQAPASVKPVRPVEQADPQPRAARRWLRPKAVQLHDGRIEISLPYTVAVTVVLITILFILAAFRIGQMQRQLRPGEATDTTSDSAKQRVPKMSPSPAMRQETPPAAARPESEIMPTSAALAPVPDQTGDHVIVLAQLSQREPLDVARAHFAEQGIATEVISIPLLRELLSSQGINTRGLGDRDGFMLVTSKYYDNPQSPGTDGYEARQKIIQAGREYKARSGSESFAPNYFSDAYGMKVR